MTHRVETTAVRKLSLNECRCVSGGDGIAGSKTWGALDKRSGPSTAERWEASFVDDFSGWK